MKMIFGVVPMDEISKGALDGDDLSALPGDVDGHDQWLADVISFRFIIKYFICNMGIYRNPSLKEATRHGISSHMSTVDTSARIVKNYSGI